MVPGMKWDKGNKLWVGGGDAIESVLSLIRGKTILLPDSSALAKPIYPVPDFGLRPYQNEGVAWLLSRKYGILADDMGLGKSAQALVAAREFGARTVIVCYNYVKGVWAPKGEIAKWWPEAEVWVARGTKPETIPDSARVILINYDILHAWVHQINFWGGENFTLLVDEAQALIGETSRRGKAIRALEATRRYFLTGTPMPNRVRDLYPILDALCPGRFGETFFNFGTRYCDGHKEEIPALGKTVYNFDGISHEGELSSRLSWVMLRRTKSQVALQLPSKTRQIVWLETGKKRAKAWEGSDLGGGAKLIRAILDRAADAKLKPALEVVLSQGARGRVVAFCFRRAVAEAVCDAARGAGLASGIVLGGLTPKARAKQIEAVSRAKAGVLAVTIDSTASGVDFSWASVGLVLELSHEPHKLLQLESRLHRWGQKDPVLIQYLCARGSVDEIICERVISKLDSEEAVIGRRDEGMATDLGGLTSDEEMLKEIMGGGR
jgi:SWI/SNF-related matrix-associated actin-dependent regulator 1 of chromatin subfamily A